MITQLPRYVTRKKTASRGSTTSNSTRSRFSQLPDLRDRLIDTHEDYSHYQRQAQKDRIIARKNKRASFEQRLKNARFLIRHAQQSMHNILVRISQGSDIPIDHLYVLVKKIIKHLDSNEDTLLLLCRDKRKDEYVFMRSVSFCIITLSFCRSLGYSESDLLHIGVGALLHDAGKMWIPNSLLNKSGRLTLGEFNKIQEHIKFSELILYRLHISSPLTRQIALQHHERTDGSGYPEGLDQNQISTLGKIAAITDVYDAITSDRCYRPASEPLNALQYLHNRGRDKFDRELVQRFIRHIGIYPYGSLVKLSNGIIGIVVGKGREELRPAIIAVYDDNTSRPIPESRIYLDEFPSLHIVDTLNQNQVPFNPQRYLL
ncbi:MAG: HD domain-containing protein [Gammaproteobacteria bacterium]|nr:HD domain-containing protein [Gammaproteobacteria bacterium]